MKILTAFLISAGLAYGQAPGKIITFNKADTEHCKVVAVINSLFQRLLITLLNLRSSLKKPEMFGRCSLLWRL